MDNETPAPRIVQHSVVVIDGAPDVYALGDDGVLYHYVRGGSFGPYSYAGRTTTGVAWEAYWIPLPPLDRRYVGQTIEPAAGVDYSLP